MIMSATDFHKRKAIGKSGHKNPIAQDIYTLLSAYEGAQTPNKKLKILILLYFLCLEYEWGKFGVKGKEISNWKKKHNLVLVLKTQIEDEVASPTFQQQFANKLGGESYKGGVQRAAVGGGTQLKGGYRVEAIAPKQNSATKYNLQTRIPAFGMSLLTQEFEADFQVNHNMGVQQSEQAAHHKIANMTLVDLFKELHKLWRNNNLQQMQFNFFDSAQRQPYLATFANGVWSCNGQTPFTTGQTFGGVAQLMYVMDMAHRLFIPAGIATGTGTFNHSSMLSGKPVLCAGTLKINGAGKLIYIDNDSGHYKPNTDALKDLVRVLANEYHIPCFGVQVMDKVNGQVKSMLQFMY